MLSERIADAGRRRPAKPQPAEARRDIRIGSKAESVTGVRLDAYNAAGDVILLGDGP
jgi:hypothetical protein